jgi:hypothetical protein
MMPIAITDISCRFPSDWGQNADSASEEFVVVTPAKRPLCYRRMSLLKMTTETMDHGKLTYASEG